MTQVNPFSVGQSDCPWTDPNGNRKYDVGEINLPTCPAFSGGTFVNYSDDVKWPYSDEYTAGIETQLPGAVRVGAMFYYRTNRQQIGQVNTLQPASAYTRHTVTIPNGPGGIAVEPAADDRRGLQHQRRGQHPEREHSRQRRLPRHRVQGRRVHGDEALLAEVADADGLHPRQERGRHQSRDGTRPERSEQHPLPDAASSATTPSRRSACRAATSCRAASACSGSMIANNGYPLRVDLLADPGGGGNAGHHADARQPADSAEPSAATSATRTW